MNTHKQDEYYAPLFSSLTTWQVQHYIWVVSNISIKNMLPQLTTYLGIKEKDLILPVLLVQCNLFIIEYAKG